MANTTTDLPVVDIAALIQKVRQGDFITKPENLAVVGAFWVKQSTQFPGASQKYRNYYLLIRVGKAFGGCCIEQRDLESHVAEELSGKTLAELLEDNRLRVRIAALDAFFGTVFPHRESTAERLSLPLGTPFERAVARDEAIVNLLDIQAGQKVGLIGVVNPIVTAIEQRQGICLPCDFNMDKTQSGLQVTQDMQPVLETADFVIATGMTLSNGSFDKILQTCRKRSIPLVLYAQTGSAILPRFLQSGVSAIAAEPFPYSQFSAEPTSIYLYRTENFQED